MTFQKNILTRAILATGLVAGLGLSQMALAEAAEGTLNLEAGLSQAMTVSCDTALSFGITTVQLDDRGGTNMVIVTALQGTTTIAGAGNASVGSGAAGSCTVSGSQANVGTAVNVTFGTAANLAGASALTLDAAGTPNNQLSVGNFTITDPEGGPSRELDANGATTFGIGGTLTIPDFIVSGNLGGYTGTVEVTVNDGV